MKDKVEIEAKYNDKNININNDQYCHIISEILHDIYNNVYNLNSLGITARVFRTDFMLIKKMDNDIFI